MQGRPPKPRKIKRKVPAPRPSVPIDEQEDLATRILTKNIRKERLLEQAFEILTGEVVNPEGPQTAGMYSYSQGAASWRVDYVWEHKYHTGRAKERYELRLAWRTLQDQGQLVLKSDDSLLDWMDNLDLMLSPECLKQLPRLKAYVTKLSQ